MQVHLFGAATPSGEALRLLFAQVEPDWHMQVYSRRLAGARRCDFADPSDFRPADIGIPAIWISFGPIWLLAPFLAQLAQQHPERLQDFRAPIACSSSFTITKRSATNWFDLALVVYLISAEDQLHQDLNKYLWSAILFVLSFSPCTERP